jgi:serine protease Do
VGEVPSDTRVAKATEKKDEKKNEAAPNRLGLVLSDVSAEDRKTLKIDFGVMVNDTDGPAERAGIRQGDVILALNNTDVKSVSQFNDILAKLDAKKAVALLVKRENQTRFVTLRIDSK